MKEPLGLQITTKVEGISVKYEIRGGNVDTGIMESEGDLTLDFGDHLRGPLPPTKAFYCNTTK